MDTTQVTSNLPILLAGADGNNDEQIVYKNSLKLTIIWTFLQNYLTFPLGCLRTIFFSFFSGFFHDFFSFFQHFFTFFSRFSYVKISLFSIALIFFHVFFINAFLSHFVFSRLKTSKKRIVA